MTLFDTAMMIVHIQTTSVYVTVANNPDISSAFVPVKLSGSSANISAKCFMILPIHQKLEGDEVGTSTRS